MSVDTKVAEATVVSIPKCGMPSARPFSLDGNEHIYLVRKEDLGGSKQYHPNWEQTGVDWHRPADHDGWYVFGFTESELRNFLTQIDFIVIQQQPTSHENASRVQIIRRRFTVECLGKDTVVADPLLPAPLIAGSWDGNSFHAFAYLVGRILGPALKRTMLLDNPNGYAREYVDQGPFQVKIWSTSNSFIERNGAYLNKIWGHDIPSGNRPFWPKAEQVSGHLIMDGNYPVAELLPNALYVHHDLTRYGHGSEFRLMERICTEAAKLIGDSGFMKSLAERNAAWQKRLHEELFAIVVKRAIPSRKSRLHEELREARAAELRARLEYIEAGRRVFGLENATVSETELAERFKAELRKLKEGRVAYITDAEIVGSAVRPKLRLTTEEIIAYDNVNRRHHLLGRYQITLDFAEGYAHFHNLDRVFQGYHGPHISSQGIPCLGSIKYELPAYISHFEIEAAATLAVAFLQNPNMGDPEGRRVLWYPIHKVAEAAE